MIVIREGKSVTLSKLFQPSSRPTMAARRDAEAGGKAESAGSRSWASKPKP